MLESGSVSRQGLTLGQLNLIARKVGVFSGKSLVDVGCGNGNWVSQLRQQGRLVWGLDEKQFVSSPVSGSDVVKIGSPAAAVPWEPHSQDSILFRGTSLISAAEFSPELMIGLANLGSSLKPRGRLLIPLTGSTPGEIEMEQLRWKTQLAPFPGTFRSRLLTPGLLSYLTLSFLFTGKVQVTVIEFQINRQTVSRLEWHQLARTAVMSRMSTPAVAS